MVKILLVQRVVTPYRRKFLQMFSSTSDLEVIVASGDNTTLPGVEILKVIDGVVIEKLENHIFGEGEKIVWQGGILRKIARGNFDVIIAEFNPRIISNILLLILAKIRGTSFIWWGHGLSPQSSWLSVQLRKCLMKISDAVILYDNIMAERLRSLDVSRDKLFVATNSIDTEGIYEIKMSIHPKARNRVLFIGRLIGSKKVDLLIRGFAEAQSRLPQDVLLTIIGDGPERENLEKLVCERNLEKFVQFVGTLYDEEKLAKYFSESFISVSPGYIGLSAVHSLAYGVPLLVADDEPHSPEISALEDGVNSVFFPSNDVTNLARHLIELSHDREYLRKLSKKAIETVERQYSVQGMIDGFRSAINYVSR